MRVEGGPVGDRKSAPESAPANPGIEIQKAIKLYENLIQNNPNAKENGHEKAKAAKLKLFFEQGFNVYHGVIGTTLNLKPKASSTLQMVENSGFPVSLRDL